MSHEPDLILQGVQRRRPPWVGFIRLCCQKFLGPHATSAFSNLVPDTKRLHDFCSTQHWIAILTDLKPLVFILQLIYVLPQSRKDSVHYCYWHTSSHEAGPTEWSDANSINRSGSAEQARGDAWAVCMSWLLVSHPAWHHTFKPVVRFLDVN